MKKNFKSAVLQVASSVFLFAILLQIKSLFQTVFGEAADDSMKYFSVGAGILGLVFLIGCLRLWFYREGLFLLFVRD